MLPSLALLLVGTRLKEGEESHRVGLGCREVPRHVQVDRIISKRLRARDSCSAWTTSSGWSVYHKRPDDGIETVRACLREGECECGRERECKRENTGAKMGEEWMRVSTEGELRTSDIETATS